MAVRIVADWKNSSRGDNSNRSTLVVPLNAQTDVHRGSMIRITSGLAVELAEGEDAYFRGVVLTKPALGHDNSTYYVTICDDPQGKFYFAVDENDTYTDYKIGDTVLIGDNCQTVKIAGTVPTPGTDNFVGRITAVWDFTKTNTFGYFLLQENWAVMVSELSGGTPVLNYYLVEIEIMGTIG